MRHRKTAADEKRIDAIKEIGCICCLMENLGWRYCEWHHLTVSGFTQGNDATIGLCLWHHRGQCEEGRNSRDMKSRYGPSLAKGSKPFYANYGSATFLLGYQDKLIEDLKRAQSIYH